MSVIACVLPAFPLALLARQEPALWERPAAALDPDERVLALTAPAQKAGVSIGQSARQARLLCPDLRLHPADLAAVQAENDALLSLLDDYTGAVEALAPGRAYLAADDTAASAALPFCQDIGRRIRRELALLAALGCDRSKFTAHAAAQQTRPGSVRVVLDESEHRFLRPLPVTLLPLPAEHQRLLAHLGIRSLGQFADLPAAAIFQQFGAAGRLAQAWAQGHDQRPVIPRQRRPTFARSAAFDPALAHLPTLLAAAERLLAPTLAELRAHLQAVQTLHAACHFTHGPSQVESILSPAPTTDARRLLGPLAARWQARTWQQPVAELTLTLSDIQEAPGEQLALFPGEGAPSDLLAATLAHLQVRYGPGRFLRAEVSDALALRVERRVRWREMGA